MPSVAEQKLNKSSSLEEATLQDLQRDLAFSDDSALETYEERAVVSAEPTIEQDEKSPAVVSISLDSEDAGVPKPVEPQQNGLTDVKETPVNLTESIATSREKRVRKRKSMDDDFVSSTRVKILSNGDAAINNDDRMSLKCKSLPSVHNIPPIKYNVGELVWARITGHPWWPCMICNDVDDNSENSHTKLVGISKLKRHYFVEFFGPSVEHAWIPDNSLIEYKGMEEFKAFAQQQVDEAATKSAKERLAERFQLKVALSRREQWEYAVQEADSIKRKSSRERVKWLTDKIETFKKNKKRSSDIRLPQSSSRSSNVHVSKKSEPLEIASKIKSKVEKGKRLSTKGSLPFRTSEKTAIKQKYRNRSKRKSINSMKDMNSGIIPKSEPVEVQESASEVSSVSQKFKSGQRNHRSSVVDFSETSTTHSRVLSCLICHRNFENHKYSYANIARHLLSCSKKSSVGKLSNCPFCQIAFGEKNWNVNHVKRHIMSCSKKVNIMSRRENARTSGTTSTPNAVINMQENGAKECGTLVSTSGFVHRESSPRSTANLTSDAMISRDPFANAQARLSLTPSELTDRLSDRIKAVEAVAKNMLLEEAAVRFNLPFSIIYSDFYGDFSDISDKAVMLGRLDLATQDIEEGGRAAASALKYRLPYRYLLMVIRGKSREYTMQQFYNDFDKWKLENSLHNVTFDSSSMVEFYENRAQSSEINISGNLDATPNNTTAAEPKRRIRSTGSYSKTNHGFAPRQIRLSRNAESDLSKMSSSSRKRKLEFPNKLTYVDEMEIENILLDLKDKSFPSVTKAAMSKAKVILTEKYNVIRPNISNEWWNYFLLKHPAVLHEMERHAHRNQELAANRINDGENSMQSGSCDDIANMPIRKSARIAKRKV